MSAPGSPRLVGSALPAPFDAGALERLVAAVRQLQELELERALGKDAAVRELERRAGELERRAAELEAAAAGFALPSALEALAARLEVLELAHGLEPGERSRRAPCELEGRVASLERVTRSLSDLHP